MKRFLCLLLILSLFLSGCQIPGERIKDPVTFYYVQSEYQSGNIRPEFQTDITSIIASEDREAAGHKDDLAYLLALYLMGPSEDDLVSPIPRGTQIFSVEETIAGISIKLSDTAKTMTDVEYTLACACLSLTCLELSNAEKVTVSSGSRAVTMTRENLLLLEDVTTATEETK